MENCVFKKICIEDSTHVRILITLEKDSVDLVIFQNENAWKSHVIAEDLNHFAKQHKLTLETYCERLLEYVRGVTDDVVFNLKNNEFVINRLLNNALKVKYFTCKLEKVNYVENAEQIMDKFYLENSQYLEKLEAIIKEKNEIDSYKTNCELKLRELIEKKQADEDELFGRYLLVLNEKKRRIQHLTELLEAFKGGRPTVNPQVAVKSRKKKSKDPPAAPKKETISESEPSESSDGSNSEEEKPPLQENVEPSTSLTYDFLQDDFSQSHMLPKRVKYESAPSIQKSDTLPTTSKSTEVCEEKTQSTPRSESPTVDLNTQQLLDML